MKEKLITILGPTASGKSEVGIEIAKALGSSITSGDAFQVYKEMDIGTAKVTKEEMQGIPHYLVDCIDPREPYSAADFQKKASEIITREIKKEEFLSLWEEQGFISSRFWKDILSCLSLISGKSGMTLFGQWERRP